jgi:hypothetical protein
MCRKCNPKKHMKYWVHIADDWEPYEKKEMLDYLESLLWR